MVSSRFSERAEQFLGVFLGQELHEAFGADACPAGEQSLEVILAQADGGCDLVEFRLAMDIGFDVLNGLLDQPIMF